MLFSLTTKVEAVVFSSFSIVGCSKPYPYSPFLKFWSRNSSESESVYALNLSSKAFFIWSRYLSSDAYLVSCLGSSELESSSTCGTGSRFSVTGRSSESIRGLPRSAVPSRLLSSAPSAAHSNLDWCCIRRVAESSDDYMAVNLSSSSVELML